MPREPNAFDDLWRFMYPQGYQRGMFGAGVQDQIAQNQAIAEGIEYEGMPLGDQLRAIAKNPMVMALGTNNLKFQRSQFPSTATFDIDAQGAKRIVENAVHKVGRRGKSISRSDILDGLFKELENRGFAPQVSKSQSTNSVYLNVPDIKQTVMIDKAPVDLPLKIRLSDHAPTAWLGTNARTHSTHQWDFGLKSEPKTLDDVYSILRSIGFKE